ncbi:hypothetical protein [Pseudorhodoferax sp.]|uniref:hypothetical protein n=1 Tax=Pseudorhodoferax sp. TaxID=1993553 RepID=UPI0039E24A63
MFVDPLDLLPAMAPSAAAHEASPADHATAAVGSLAPPCPEAQLPPDFDQRVREVGEW